MRLNAIAMLAWLAMLATTQAAGEAQAAPRQIRAEAEAQNRELALENAHRTLIAMGVGYVVDAEVMGRNTSLISDWIVTRALSYVRTYTIESERPTYEDGWQVELSTEVTPLLEELLRDKTSRELILSWMKKPRLLVLVGETNIQDTTDTLSNAEGSLVARLTNAGFTVLDRGVGLQPEDSLAGPEQARQAALAAVSDLDSGTVDLVAIGVARSRSGTTPTSLRQSGMVSMQARLTLHLVDPARGEVLATRTHQITEPDINPRAAGRRALQQVARPAADSLMVDVIARVPQWRGSDRAVRLSIEGISFSEREEIQRQLGRLAGVKRVVFCGYQESSLKLLLDLEGTLDFLAAALGERKLAGQQWEVLREDWSSLRLQRAAEGKAAAGRENP
jgi:hypothetical protein